NPTDSDWHDFPFDFHDEHGNELQSTVSQTIRTEDLGYRYEDATPPAVPRRRGLVAASKPPSDEPAELAGATDSPVDLLGSAERVALHLATPAGIARRRGAAARPERVYLNLEA